MNKNQLLLANLLSAAIRGMRPPADALKHINWEALFEEAKQHEVYPLLYPVLKDMQEDDLGPDEELMTEWQKLSLVAGIKQIQHFREIGKVLGTLHKADMRVIALKGLVLRDLYPEPELRTMSDADLLVHVEDLERIKSLLLQMGYAEEGFDSKHIHFSHDHYLPIELHWALSYKQRIENTEYWENTLWENAVAITIGGVPVLTLSPEDQLLHLCLHMANHIISAGFGLRQLCDFVLFVEAKGDAVDWDIFYARSKEMGIDRFTLSIFIVCKLLFNLEIPYVLDFWMIKDDSGVELLIDDIFSGGVYGRRTEDRTIGSIYLHYASSNDPDTPPGGLSHLMSFLFPSAKKLGSRYDYAIKYPILTPFAWVHRLIYGLIRKDYTVSAKKASLYSPASKSIFEERSRLLRWLGLR